MGQLLSVFHVVQVSEESDRRRTAKYQGTANTCGLRRQFQFRWHGRTYSTPPGWVKIVRKITTLSFRQRPRLTIAYVRVAFVPKVKIVHSPEPVPRGRASKLLPVPQDSSLSDDNDDEHDESWDEASANGHAWWESGSEDEVRTSGAYSSGCHLCLLCFFSREFTPALCSSSGCLSG